MRRVHKIQRERVFFGVYFLGFRDWGCCSKIPPKPTKQILAAILPCMEMPQNKAQMSKGKINSRKKKKNWEVEMKRKSA